MLLLEREGRSLFVPAVLAGGHAELVKKDELQFLIFTKKIVFSSELTGGLFLVEIKCAIKELLSVVKKDDNTKFFLWSIDLSQQP